MEHQPSAIEIHQNHTADRAHYDTPGSISYCACESCNVARRHHGRPERCWRWFGGTWDAVVRKQYENIHSEKETS